MTQVFGNSLPTVIRCRLQDIVPPLKLQIDYSLEPDMASFDLAIFYSFTTKQPDGSNCVQKYMNKPKTIVVPSRDENGRVLKSYEHQMVYIAFVSEVGCSL